MVSVQAKHTQENSASWGVDGETGSLCDMAALGIWEPLAVKAQTYKTAVEVSPLLVVHKTPSPWTELGLELELGLGLGLELNVELGLGEMKYSQCLFHIQINKIQHLVRVVLMWTGTL